MINRNHKLTIHEIAELAGVSIGTVSRALNDKPGVSQKTKSKIMSLVGKTGYVPDAGARRLAQGSLELVGVAPFSDNTLRSPYYSILLDAIQEHLFQTGYTARVIDPKGGDSLSHRMAGFIVPGIHLDDPRLGWLAQSQVPYVVVGRAPQVGWVDIDNHQGIAQAMQHLFKLGHRQIAHITGSPVGQTTQARLEAYQQGLLEAQLPLRHELVWDGQFSELGGYRATRRAIEAGLEFTAILSASDEMALGALAAIHDAGLQVPLDISVIGFDDLPLVAHTSPALTTVHQPIRQVGHQAADLLVETIKHKTLRSEVIPTRLVVRASSGPVVRRS